MKKTKFTLGFIILTLVAILSLSIVTACASPSSPTPTTSAPATTSKPAASPSASVAPSVSASPSGTASPKPSASASPSASVAASPSPAASPKATASPAATALPAPSASAAAFTINVSNKAGIGNYLVSDNGMTLYYFKNDTVGKSNVTGNTLITWPIFYTSQFNLPPSLNVGDFSNITRPDGPKQTTYKGYPLYLNVNDKAPGDTNGQGVNNLWFVINPNNFPPTPSSSSGAAATPTSSP